MPSPRISPMRGSLRVGCQRLGNPSPPPRGLSNPRDWPLFRYCPPVTSMVTPVTKSASDEARKQMTRAWSSGVATRPSGVRWISAAWPSAERRSQWGRMRSESVRLGAMALTVTPCGPSATAAPRGADVAGRPAEPRRLHVHRHDGAALARDDHRGGAADAGAGGGDQCDLALESHDGVLPGGIIPQRVEWSGDLRLCVLRGGERRLRGSERRPAPDLHRGLHGVLPPQPDHARA